MRRVGLQLLLVCCVAFAAVAQEARPLGTDPELEKRLMALSQELRCLVCQNETLADSRADLADDLRQEIREQMRAGKSDKEIISFLTARYGDFVLYRPRITPVTYLLWFGPFVLLAAGLGLLYRQLKHRRALIVNQPLSQSDRRQAEALLNAPAEKEPA